MDQPNPPALIAGARAVLDANWMGESTKPAPRLYPHQWSWDSAFIAIGYARYDQDRAERELRALFAAQWSTGLVPQIVFSPTASGYFPGPDAWGLRGDPRIPAGKLTSGIVQPPVHASAAWHVYRHAQDEPRARAFLAELYPKLRAWHDYLHRERDPRGEGLVYVRHPWESGMDNSPLWDAALARISPAPGEVPPYERQDTGHVDAAERPLKADYDRYVYLMALFQRLGYNEARIAAECPYLMQDVLFNSLLCRGDRDLAALARLLGDDPAPLEARAERTAAAINAKLWDEAAGVYLDYDLTTNERVPAVVAGGLTPLFAGVPDAARAERLYALLNSPAFARLDEPVYPVPTYSRLAEGYSPNRYWRGPIWVNMNWLIYQGLRAYGRHDYAARLRAATIELVARQGFYEYFNPESGRGHGTDSFSWTAALLIDLLYEG